VADLDVPKEESAFRFDARQKLLSQLDDVQRRTETRSTQMHESAYHRAFRLLTSQRRRKHSTSTANPKPSATATAVTRSARVASWPAG